MARSVAVWVGGAATACLLIGVGYLPPRGLPKWAEGRPYPSFAANQQRARARELLTRWQVANAALLRARYHDQLGPLLAAQRKGEHLGPALILETDSATRRFGEGIIRAAFDSAWRQLNLGVTKVSIGILMQDRPPVTERKGPPVVPGTFSSTYLLPDSVDRATCLVVTQTPFFATNKTYLNQARLVRWATGVLGPCAYYAKFGVPSPRVEQWLATRQFDVAILPSWSARSWAGPEDLGWRISFMLQERELWWGIYSYAPNVLSCFAGRPEACRRDLQTADRVVPGAPRPRVVTPIDPWDASKVRLIGAEGYLADLLRETGDDRFQDFWSTSLPVDSALTLAAGKPIGEYTVSWMRGFSTAPRFGGAASWTDTGIALGLVALLIGASMLGQGRREVK